MFFISVAYNYILRRPHHNLVLKDEVDKSNKEEFQLLGNLYLGALPMARIGLSKVKHHDQIINEAIGKQRPLGLVVGTVEDFELESQSSSFFKPVSPIKW